MGHRSSPVIFVAFLAVVLGFSLLAPGVGAKRQATPAGNASAIDDVVPEEILSALLAEPFPEALLPIEFADPRVLEWEEGDTDLEGALGGVGIMLSPDHGSIAYIVFPDVIGAQRRLAETNDVSVAADLAAIVDSFAGITVGGVSVPGRMVVYPDYVVCLVQAGPVIVIGGSFSDDAASRRQTAVDLAEAGLSHLLAVTTGATGGTPDAVASPDATAGS
jgi:hypothetical protein